jgi:hypothetical protein
MVGGGALPIAGIISAVKVDHILEYLGNPGAVIVRVGQQKEMLDFFENALREVHLDEVVKNQFVAKGVHDPSFVGRVWAEKRLAPHISSGELKT